MPPEIATIAADAAADGVAQKLLTEVTPDLLVLAGGHQPAMKPLSEQSWQDFQCNLECGHKNRLRILPRGTVIALVRRRKR